MKKEIFFIIFGGLLSLSSGDLTAQPYIDLLNARLVMSPDLGISGPDKNRTELNYFNISTTVPFQFKNKRDAVILSPSFERWSSEVSSVDACSRYHYGVVLPLSFLKQIPNSNWTLLTTAIVRMNDMTIRAGAKYQFGGALLAANYSKRKNLTYKMGLYINGELFGLFIIPLLGIDWKINDKTNLFGVLPAAMTLDRRIVHWLHGGASFRTFTNSYRDSGLTYFRVDENQLGLFADIYLSRHIVVNFEAGHSLFRKIRSGARHEERFDWNVRDNFYFKTAFAYRIWLR